MSFRKGLGTSNVLYVAFLELIKLSVSLNLLSSRGIRSSELLSSNIYFDLSQNPLTKVKELLCADEP